MPLGKDLYKSANHCREIPLAEYADFPFFGLGLELRATVDTIERSFLPATEIVWNVRVVERDGHDYLRIEGALYSELD